MFSFLENVIDIFYVHNLKLDFDKSCILMLCKLRLVATNVFNMRLLHAVALSKKLLWLVQTNVITLKTQTQAVNAR